LDNWKPDVNSTGRSREENRDYIRGLLREREMCVGRGLDERVKLIDAELERVGHEAVKPEQRAERRPAGRKSEKR
jgi:hypothetical protein